MSKNSQMKNIGFLILLFLIACSAAPTLAPTVNPEETGAKVSQWVTLPDRSLLLAGSYSLTFKDDSGNANKIVIDTTLHFQTMDGFGYTLTGGSAQLMNQKLTPANRSALLRELFLTEGNGIGISYLRVSIGASDLDEKVFSYNDLPTGETDIALSKFSLAPDRVNLIPVLKEILMLNPDIKIMGS
ncbi:MAG: glucosylceramidase, partial [Cyclobacteriaceae bacterium]|nr:glucosylceramidase [Cyclobacteriaceae bacterium]